MASISQTQDDAWKASMDHAMQAIVTIHAATPFSFGNFSRWSGQATGFVVDTDIGIILTNRHVVSEAPMHARAVFQSGARQCPIKPLYIDPHHDFAFCKCDVELLRETTSIQLRPEFAKVGREVRVLGNDMGRVMSILQGVISRVDCNPPCWDSLINYIQASADTAGGSSGSPVIAQDGSAVALMSGGYNQSSTDLFLPLDLPLRTLKALRSGRIPPRGTIQSTWILEKPADCHARGLSYEEIQQYSSDGSGLLVAQVIVPNGPSDTHVKEADILRTVDGQPVTSLPLFEQLLDGAVGTTIEVQVQRHGNVFDYEIQVQDLWTLVPYRLLEYAGSVFQDLRYETAVDHHVPVEGVVLSNAEGPFLLKDYGDKIIRSLNNQSTPNLNAFIDIARKIADQASVAVEYQILGNDPNSRYQRIIIDRHWLREKMVLRSRKEDDIAAWDIMNFGPAPPATPPASRNLPIKATTEHFPIVRKIVSNTVEVHAWTPYKTNGALSGHLQAMGLVINAKEGFVVTARSFMPSTMCILHVVFADSIEVPATKVYDHALGFTVIRYDTSLIEGCIQSVSFSKQVPRAQDKMTIYGPHTDGLGVYPMEITVTSIGPLTGDYECGKFYHPVNVDVLHFKTNNLAGAGVLLDKDGGLQGLWLPFFFDDGIKWVGVQLSLLLPAFEKLQQGTMPPACRMLDVELDEVHKNDVKAFGVHKETVQNFPRREFIRVKKVSCKHENGLKAGDIIVKRGKSLVTRMSDLRDMFVHESLEMSIIRGQVEVNVDVPTITVCSRQSDRVVWFAGAQFESPYSPVPLCTRELYSQIFVTDVRIGSPADMYGLQLHHFVTAVQGVATIDFDDFTEELKKLPNDRFCQLTLVDLRGSPHTVSLMFSRQDLGSFDAQQKKQSPNNWHLQPL